MLQGKSFICVIPARGGSKGIPNKNIKPMLGRPLISYCIQAAKESGIFDKIVVTTDSSKIIGVVMDLDLRTGDEIIPRPSLLAKDDSLVQDAVEHALLALTEKYNYVLLLEPTSPLVTGADIRLAAKQMLSKNANMIISVCKASPDAATIGRLGKDLSMKNFLPKEVRICPRQQRPEYHYLNSAIYMGKWEIFKEKKDYYEQNVIAYVMPPESSVHIDDMGDWRLAEYFLSKRYNRRVSRWRAILGVAYYVVRGKRLRYG